MVRKSVLKHFKTPFIFKVSTVFPKIIEMVLKVQMET